MNEDNETVVNMMPNGKPDSGVAQKRFIDRKKKRRQIENTNYSWSAGWSVDDRYVHRRKNSKYLQWLKREANRKIRRMPDVANGGEYKKSFDVWWSYW